jgi:hypothetical protein
MGARGDKTMGESEHQKLMVQKWREAADLTRSIMRATLLN